MAVGLGAGAAVWLGAGAAVWPGAGLLVAGAVAGAVGSAVTVEVAFGSVPATSVGAGLEVLSAGNNKISLLAVS